MTAPTRRQLMAGSLAALGAAGAPAIAESEAPARENVDMLDYLPDGFRFVAYMNCLAQQRVEARQEFIDWVEAHADIRPAATARRLTTTPGRWPSLPPRPCYHRTLEGDHKYGQA